MSALIRSASALLCVLPALIALTGAATAERASDAVVLAQATSEPEAGEDAQGTGKNNKKKGNAKVRGNTKAKGTSGGQKAAPGPTSQPSVKQPAGKSRAPSTPAKTATPPATTSPDKATKSRSSRKGQGTKTKPAAKPAFDAPAADDPAKGTTTRDRYDAKRKPAPTTTPSAKGDRGIGPAGPGGTKFGTPSGPGDKDRAPKEAWKKPPKREDVIRSYKPPPKPARTFDELKRGRKEKVLADGKSRVIEEADRRVIVKQDKRVFIRHDDADRFRRLAPDARTIRRADGTTTTFMTRRDGVRIYDVTDRHGRLLYRYRRLPGGREIILIDNRRYYARDSRTRDLLLGVGIGLVVGSAVALSAPDIRIPRDAYIVDYGYASDDDLYEALIAPPIERLDRGYSLDEVRYTPYLRDRMRRVDLDIVTFDFGSWEVGHDQERALERMANAINRALDRDPDEIFMIEGHTDAVGSEEDNLTLSDRRAQAVAEILTTAYGVPPENLITQGYGEEQLKIPTDGPERTNRRISFRRIGPLLSGRYEDAP